MRYLMIFLLMGCQITPATPDFPQVTPSVKISSPISRTSVKEDIKDVLDKGKEAILPDEAKTAKPRPKINIHSSPQNLLNLTTATVPSTFTFEAAHLNESESSTIIAFHWRIEKLGIPLLDSPELIFESKGQIVKYTFQDTGRYKVTLTAHTDTEDKISTSLVFWGRS